MMLPTIIPTSPHGERLFCKCMPPRLITPQRYFTPTINLLLHPPHPIISIQTSPLNMPTNPTVFMRPLINGPPTITPILLLREIGAIGLIILLLRAHKPHRFYEAINQWTTNYDTALVPTAGNTYTTTSYYDIRFYDNMEKSLSPC